MASSVYAYYSYKIKMGEKIIGFLGEFYLHNHGCENPKS
jgi:hypothetical protein